MLAEKVGSLKGPEFNVKFPETKRIIRMEPEWTYECQDLINRSFPTVHANRIRLCCNYSLDVPQELLRPIKSNYPKRFISIKLLEFRDNSISSLSEVKEKWMGFNDENNTWEPLKNLSDDIPELFQNFLEAFAY